LASDQKPSARPTQPRVRGQARRGIVEHLVHPRRRARVVSPDRADDVGAILPRRRDSANPHASA